MLTAYEPIGLSIEFLILSCACGVGMVVWVSYWLCRSFRARFPVTRFGRSVLWCVVSLVFLVAVLFPPVREAGIWWDESTGQPVSLSAAGELDRFYFGWKTKFVWVRQIGSEESVDSGGVQGVTNVSARCVRARWVVEWPVLFTEACCLALLALPFARAR